MFPDRILPPALLAALALTMLPAADIRAADLAIGIPPGGLGTDLHVARDEIELRDGPLEIESRLTRFGLTLSESYGDHLSMGVMFGYAWTTHRDQPLTDGLRLSGNYAGLNLHLDLPMAQRLRAGFMGRVLYHWMDDRIDDLRVRIEWLHAEAALTLQTDLTPHLMLYTGPMYAHADIEQRARGGVDESRDFRVSQNGGVVAGLLFEVDHRGWIGVEARSGVQDGFALSFQRRF